MRATVAVPETVLQSFTDRLADAATLLTGADGPRVIEAAVRRARAAADVDAVLAACRY
jgi:hypothetical protein